MKYKSIRKYICLPEGFPLDYHCYSNGPQLAVGETGQPSTPSGFVSSYLLLPKMCGSTSDTIGNDCCLLIKSGIDLANLHVRQ